MVSQLGTWKVTYRWADSTGPEDPPRWKVEAHYRRGFGVDEVHDRKALVLVTEAVENLQPSRRHGRQDADSARVLIRSSPSLQLSSWNIIPFPAAATNSTAQTKGPDDRKLSTSATSKTTDSDIMAVRPIVGVCYTRPGCRGTAQWPPRGDAKEES